MLFDAILIGRGIIKGFFEKLKFRHTRKIAEITAVSTLLLIFVFCLNYNSLQDKNPAYQVQAQGGEEANDHSLSKFCGQHKAACQSQDHPDLITWIQSVWLQDLHQPKRPLNFEKPPIFRGQIGVPPYVDRLLEQKKNGFFVECGAWDGEELSNTILFEIKRQWKGLLIEPNIDGFTSLKTKNRNAILVNSCLASKTKPEEIEFVNAGTGGGRPNDVVLGWADVGKDQVNVFKTNVTCLPIFSILESLGNPKVDYFSLDVEGSEWEVLQTIPWDRVDVSVWSIEVNQLEVLGHPKSELKMFMEKRGYLHVTDIAQDMIFAKKHLLVGKEKFRGKWLI